jgi:hypothetical protein
LNFSRQSLLIRDVIFRVVNRIMAALFAFAVVVQYNDPDPLVWMSIYAAACAVAAVRAYKGSVPLAAPAAVSLVALVWGIAIAGGVRNPDIYRHMFDAWEMRSAPIEEAREASGLLIVAGWMAAILVTEIATPNVEDAKVKGQRSKVKS